MALTLWLGDTMTELDTGINLFVFRYIHPQRRLYMNPRLAPAHVPTPSLTQGHTYRSAIWL